MIAAFTIFTFLLFAISTAHDVSKFSTESISVADSDVVLPIEKPESIIGEYTVNDRLPESEKTQTFDVSTIDPTPRLIFSRSHPIKRHFFGKTTRIPLRFVRRHPCRKFQKTFMIPRSKMSYGNDMILSDKTYSFDPKSFGDQVPTKWLELKHNYGHRHHHGKHEEFEIKHEFDQEKKREHKGSFMRGIRKFLKHTFD